MLYYILTDHGESHEVRDVRRRADLALVQTRVVQLHRVHAQPPLLHAAHPSPAAEIVAVTPRRPPDDLVEDLEPAARRVHKVVDGQEGRVVVSDP